MWLNIKHNRQSGMKTMEMIDGRTIAASLQAAPEEAGKEENRMYVLRKCPQCGNRKLKLLDDKRHARVKVVCTECGVAGGSFRYGIGISREYREAVRMSVQAWNTAEVV